MKVLTPEQITSFSRQWLWLCTDRVREFEHLLRAPLADVALMKAHTVRYFDYVYSLAPDASASFRATAFEQLLAHLETHGEDVDHLYDWTFAVCEYMQPLPAQMAMSFWQRAFKELSRGRRDPVSALPEHKLAEIVRSYIDDVRDPAIDASDEQDESESAWLTSPQRRGEFDNVVWNYHFSEINVDPALYIVDGYREALMREWWRKTRTALSDEELAGLHQELTALALYPEPSVEAVAANDRALLEGFVALDLGMS